MPNKKEELIEEFKNKFIEFRDDYKPHFNENKFHEGVEYKTSAEDAIDWLSKALDTHATNEVRRVVDGIKDQLFNATAEAEEMHCLAHTPCKNCVVHVRNAFLKALTQEPLTVEEKEI